MAEPTAALFGSGSEESNGRRLPHALLCWQKRSSAGLQMLHRRCCRCRTRWRRRSCACWVASRSFPASRRQCWRRGVQQGHCPGRQHASSGWRRRWRCRHRLGGGLQPPDGPSARSRCPASASGSARRCARITGALWLAQQCCLPGGLPLACPLGKRPAATERRIRGGALTGCGCAA